MGARLLLAVLVATSACAPRSGSARRKASKPPEGERLDRRAMPQASVESPPLRRAAVPPMSRARANAAAFVLDDGRVLVSGGQSGYGRGITASTELFDPRKETWAPGPSMSTPRYNHRVARLRDGRFLVVGGTTEGHRSLRECELYDPRAGVWKRTGSLREARAIFGIATLPDGRVLVAGGFASNSTLDSVEIYDPRTGVWSPGPRMSTRRQDGVLLAPLPDGRLLAAGGMYIPDTTLSTAEVFEPASGRWRRVGSMMGPRAQGTLVALPDGRILAAGGASHADGRPPEAAELFDPATGRWGAVDAPSPGLVISTAWLGGRPVLVGGYHGGSLSRVEAFDARTGTWEALPPLRAPRLYAVVAPLADGRVLVAGGEVGPNAIASAEILTPEGRPDREEFDPGPSAPAAVVADPVRARPAERDPSSPRVPRRATRADDYAVIVGVEGYKSLPSAAYAGGDARAMASAVQALGVPEENVVLLEGTRAGLADLSKYVEEWLPRRASARSRVYFFFSGHGAPDVEGGTPYLMPWDGDAAFVRSTGYSLSRLYDSLGKLPAREVIVALDSCFSGTGGRSVLAPGLRPLVNLRMPPAPRRRVSVLTASEGGEAAGGLPDVGHGAFTYRLLEGLGGAADEDGDGGLTLAELHGYARKRVILDARAMGREQTPTLSTPEPGLRLY